MTPGPAAQINGSRAASDSGQDRPASPLHRVKWRDRRRGNELFQYFQPQDTTFFSPPSPEGPSSALGGGEQAPMQPCNAALDATLEAFAKLLHIQADCKFAVIRYA